MASINREDDVTKFIYVGLLFFLVSIVVGCAAHTPKVPMPGDTAGPIEWRDYYNDQFKVLKDKVPPPDEQASLEQRVAYDDAKRAYEKKKAVGLVVGGCLLAISLVIFIGTLSQL
jgi:hypothetical protein